MKHPTREEIKQSINMVLDGSTIREDICIGAMNI